MIRMRNLLLLALVSTTLLGCKKEEIKVDTLTSNPFDADYQGPDIFSLVSATTVVVIVEGTPTNRLAVTVRVNVDLFPRDTPFQVRVRPLPDGTATILQGTTATAGGMTFSRTGVEPGQQYCWDLQLGNADSFGGGNSICATAE